VRSLNDIVDSNNELGEYGVALDASVKAMALATLPVALGFVRTSRGIALVGAGRVDEGLAVFEEGIERLRALDRPQSILEFRSNFARALVQRGVNEQAESNAAVAMAQTSRERREALGVHALCRQRRGDFATAVTEASAALAIKERPMGERADLIPLLARGQAYLATHRDVDALADLERAVAIGDGHKGDRAIRADAHFALARALVENKGDRARAAQLASRAAMDFDSTGLSDHSRDVRAWMARENLGS
jgi:tetratricopeptide (TPR) repeat protein